MLPLSIPMVFQGPRTQASRAFVPVYSGPESYTVVPPPRRRLPPTQTLPQYITSGLRVPWNGRVRSGVCGPALGVCVWWLFGITWRTDGWTRAGRWNGGQSERERRCRRLDILGAAERSDGACYCTPLPAILVSNLS